MLPLISFIICGISLGCIAYVLRLFFKCIKEGCTLFSCLIVNLAGINSSGSTGSGGIAGNGGVGKEYNITGSNVYYAGGGGGACYDSSAGRGAGGSGGGGNGAQGLATVGTAGTANTGGGGGGWSGRNATAGYSGGSGVVILRYPNTKTITIGSGLTGTTATDGSSKVTTFTAGTGNIQLS